MQHLVESFKQPRRAPAKKTVTLYKFSTYDSWALMYLF